MKRWWRRIFTAAVVIFASVTPSVAQEWPDLRLTTRHWPPYQVVEGDKVTGPAVNAVECALRSMGVRFRIEPYPYIRAQRMVELGEADGFFASSQTKERDSYAVLSAPISRSVIRWYFLKDRPGDPVSNKNLPVATIRGSTGAAALDDAGYTQVTRLATAAEVLRLLFAGRVDAVMLTQPTVEEAFRTTLHSNESHRLTSIRFKDNPLGVYFGKSFLEKNPGFLKEFNQSTEKCFVNVMIGEEGATQITLPLFMKNGG